MSSTKSLRRNIWARASLLEQSKLENGANHVYVCVCLNRAGLCLRVCVCVCNLKWLVAFLITKFEFLCDSIQRKLTFNLKFIWYLSSIHGCTFENFPKLFQTFSSNLFSYSMNNRTISLWHEICNAPFSQTKQWIGTMWIFFNGELRTCHLSATKSLD